MVKLDKCIGDVLFISFCDLDRMKDVGIKRNGHYKLLGYDQLGLWFKHPGIIIQQTEDGNGRPVPKNKQKKEQIKAHFIVRWDNINSLMHYPDRIGFDLEQAKIKVGFQVISKSNSLNND